MSLKPDDSDGSTTSGVDPNVILDNTLDNSQSNYSTTNNGIQPQTQTTRNDQQQQQQIRSRRELNRISKLKCQKRKHDLVNSLQAEVAKLTAMHDALCAENQQLCLEFLACCNGIVQTPVNQNKQVERQELLQRHDAPMQGSVAQLNQIDPYLSQLLANPSMTATSALRHILPIATTAVPQSVAQEGFVMMDDDATAYIWPSVMADPWSGTQEHNVASLPNSSTNRDMGIESPNMFPFTTVVPWSGTQEDNAANRPSSIIVRDLDRDGNGFKLLLDKQPDVTLGPKEAVADNQ